ncbi:uncharacterized protein LOC115683770 [Syzygium oleosum]|uniref:uncharacterized protein LOC115683770 n=1 Tax=Syzygium oleosum TaxID=219896 RepID=UPI0024B9EE81|nr:uncharacterized protein LOC115683770 [Syzygium oleosum]
MEFMQLKQNDLTVDQYEAKFVELSRFAPRLVKDKDDNAKRLRDGLRLNIRSKLVPLNLKDYNELYEHAQLVEKDLAELAETTLTFQARPNRQTFQPNFRRDKRPMQTRKRPIVPNKRNNVGGFGFTQNNRPAMHTQSPNNVYHTCGKQHGGTPYSVLKECYWCGQRGHILGECPVMKQQRITPPQQLQQLSQNKAPQQGNFQRLPAQGRVYTVTHEEAEASKTVISGIIYVCNKNAYALFDTGATHSFISARFVKLIRLSPRPLEISLCVSTPLRDTITSTLICKDCKITISGHDQIVDLIVLTMYDFDVILGMDWLRKQRANVDCYRKII